MIKMLLFEGVADEYLSLAEVNSQNCDLIKNPLENGLTILWFTEDGSRFLIDGLPYEFKKDQILCLTEYHKVEVLTLINVKMVRFNKPFYCILDHDPQVGCRGVLFFGASDLPLIDIPEHEMKKFDILWQMFVIEFESKDNLQIEMLQMMLKRLLILCTRLSKEQNLDQSADKGTVDLIRDFNYQVEVNFRTMHSVGDYAALLHKSPKTLANYFSKYYHKSPLQVIQGRIMMEARRILLYAEKPVKEIAYELGFDTIQAFSRFFKGKEGISPSEYKENRIKG